MTTINTTGIIFGLVSGIALATTYPKMVPDAVNYIRKKKEGFQQTITDGAYKTIMDDSAPFFASKMKLGGRAQLVEPSDQVHVTQKEEDDETLEMYYSTNIKGSDKDAYTDKVALSNEEPTMDATDLLPKQVKDDWFDPEFNRIEEIPLNSLIDVSHFAIDTVNQTLKNASHDIRGSLPNPRTMVSPFMNSSYDFDYDNNIKSWC